jgi:hypothetical protein
VVNYILVFGLRPEANRDAVVYANISKSCNYQYIQTALPVTHTSKLTTAAFRSYITIREIEPNHYLKMPLAFSQFTKHISLKSEVET